MRATVADARLSGEALIAIPARFGSTRLPGKALLDLEGRTLVQRVAANMLAVPGAEVVVVTDDERIARSAEAVGARAFVSRRAAESGSDRIRHYLDDARPAWPEILVNVQGDEPLLEPEVVTALIARVAGDRHVRVATCLRALDADEASDPHVVKGALLPTGVVEDFARLPAEDGDPARTEADLACPRRHRWLAHVGAYAFRAEAFRAFTDLPPSPRERSERLEQLRMLENGIAVHGVAIEGRPIALDTPVDAERVRAILRAALGARS
ncbi:MAG TPA: 3-deoxy-manno-octulosonate cytidylyltransferase [Gemmatimonadota bacterium]|jgi:3-deoxy-manno-octulosonate cytidylyltransferase (CMP-KDO synthetase)